MGAVAIRARCAPPRHVIRRSRTSGKLWSPSVVRYKWLKIAHSISAHHCHSHHMSAHCHHPCSALPRFPYISARHCHLSSSSFGSSSLPIHQRPSLPLPSYVHSLSSSSFGSSSLPMLQCPSLPLPPYVHLLSPSSFSSLLLPMPLPPFIHLSYDHHCCSS